MRSRDIRDMLQNPRSKKDDTKKIIVLAKLKYAENQLSPCLNQISFCVFQGWKNHKNLAFRDFFTGSNFRDCHLKEYFAGI